MGLKKRYEVYVLLDEDREVRYVGCTRNPDKRRRAHYLTPGREDLVYETYEVYGFDRAEAEKAEQSLIRMLVMLGHDLLNVTMIEDERERQQRLERRKEVRKSRVEDNRNLSIAEKVIRRGERSGGSISSIDFDLLKRILEKFGEFLDDVR